MGIFDRFRHKAHDTGEEARSSMGGAMGGTPDQSSDAMTDPARRAALAHDEAADAFPDTAAKAGEPRQPHHLSAREEEEMARENMTAEGDPWD
ncbi:hypothetical protein [Kitasatospora sp. NBC_00315]|uniref:hypothetical protein n=1 Tax=Kitasatospora sp. NBC_00315 TaxID=2975963 RepID=UPI003246ECF3